MRELRNMSELNRTIKRNDVKEVIELLNDSMVDPSIDYNYAIRWASDKSHLEIVKLSPSDESNLGPSDGNSYAIVFASEKGHLEVVKSLLEDPRVGLLVVILRS